MSRRFADRAEAGRELAARLVQMHLARPIVVLALPRGGVPIGTEVARALNAPLDLVLVRKIGTPWQPELAVAAVVDGTPPDIVIDEEIQRSADISADYIEAQAQEELHEIRRRRQVYLRGRPPVDVEGCTAIVVDDGIATGTTMRAALKALRRRRPASLVVAVPVAPPDTIEMLASEADQIVCLEQPEPFHAVGLHYGEFHQVGDDEVLAALDAASPSQRGAKSIGGAEP
jgi:putative phosphoribosyl transferase